MMTRAPWIRAASRASTRSSCSSMAAAQSAPVTRVQPKPLARATCISAVTSPMRSASAAKSPRASAGSAPSNGAAAPAPRASAGGGGLVAGQELAGHAGRPGAEEQLVAGVVAAIQRDLGVDPEQRRPGAPVGQQLGGADADQLDGAVLRTEPALAGEVVGQLGGQRGGR